MLNIDDELLDNLSSKNFLPIDNESFEVLNLIKNYNLDNDLTLLNTVENQYTVITNFIIELYLTNQFLPEDLKNFFKNSYNYKIFLFDNIKNRMKSIINESSTLPQSTKN